MATMSTERRIREARLIAAAPDRVYDELRAYGAAASPWDVDEELEKSLLERGGALIELGLAQYARSTDVLKAIHKRTREQPKNHLEERFLHGLAVALFSNEVEWLGLSSFPTGIIGEEEFAQLIAADRYDELAALMSNPSLDSAFIESLYKNEGLAATLSDERRCQLVRLSAANPRLTREVEYEDAPDLVYHEIQRAIVTLLSTAPVTEPWLRALRPLVDELSIKGAISPSSSIAPVLDRWAVLMGDETLAKKEGYYTGLSLVDEFRCLVAAVYGRHFVYEKGKLSEFVQLGAPNSPEVALRCAYYGKAPLTEPEMQAGFERDKQAYVLAVLCNDHVFYRDHLRQLLESEQLGEDLRHVYRRRCEALHDKRASFDPRPMSEWLAEGAPPTSGELAKLEALEAKVDALAKPVTTSQSWIMWGFIIIGVLILAIRH